MELDGGKKSQLFIELKLRLSQLTQSDDHKQILEKKQIPNILF